MIPHDIIEKSGSAGMVANTPGNFNEILSPPTTTTHPTGNMRSSNADSLVLRTAVDFGFIHARPNSYFIRLVHRKSPPLKPPTAPRGNDRGLSGRSRRPWNPVRPRGVLAIPSRPRAQPVFWRFLVTFINDFGTRAGWRVSSFSRAVSSASGDGFFRIGSGLADLVSLAGFQPSMG